MLIALGLITVVFGFYATKVRMTYDNAKIIPQDDPDYVEYVKFKSVFGEDGNVMVIGVQSPHIFEIGFLNDWYELSNDVERIPGVEKVVSIAKAYSLKRNDSIQQLTIQPLIAEKFRTQQDVDSFKRFLGSLKFYDKLGFYKINEHIFKLGNDNQTDYILQKDLIF